MLTSNILWESFRGKPPSNVTRISRAIRPTCLDGTKQIVAYLPGVGSRGRKLDHLLGGAFGLGLDQDIREAYNFICNNYEAGDEIYLVGFSRGAFTARSVADFIASIGLLNMDGMKHFYAIFNDYENMGNLKRRPHEFLCPDLPPLRNRVKGEKDALERRRKRRYLVWLRDEMRYTRDHINT